MKNCFHLALLFVAVSYVQQLANATEKRPNVLFIAIDDLRNDLGALGVAHAMSPHIDAFAATARVFDRHYVQVPTCGASRCALMRGRYPTVASQVGNDGIKQTQKEWVHQSLPGVFHQNGYRTYSLGKITHYPGGLTGKEWAEGAEELPGVWDRSWIPQSPWKTPVSIMHGYANGVARKPGKSPPLEAFDGSDDSYPDAWVASEAIDTLKKLSSQQEPWFFCVGFFKPHLPFAAPKRWHDLHQDGIPDLSGLMKSKPTWPSGWHNSSEFRGNYGHAPGRNPDLDIAYAREIRQAYAACVSYMDEQVGRVLTALREADREKDTIVVLWSDHGFLLGEHSIWGKHCLYEKALRSPLMIRYPGMQQSGLASHATVETVDLFPTLVDLCQLPLPDNLDGKSLRPQLENPEAIATKNAHGFWSGGQRTIRTERWRLIVQHGNDADSFRTELFDMQNDADESQNVADANPSVVKELLSKIAVLPDPSRKPKQ